MTLDISQYEGPANPPYDSEPGSYVHIDVQQIATAGLKGNKECRCLDWRFREVSDWMFGRVRGRSKFIRVRGSKENGEGEEEDLAGARGEDAEFLRSNWLVEDDEGPQQLISYVESLDAGWTATQVWGFQMVEPAPGEEPERRHCRNIVVAKGDDRVRFRLVYDYVPPAAEGGKEDDVDDDLAY